MSEREAKLEAVARATETWWHKVGMWELHSIEVGMSFSPTEHRKEQRLRRLKARKKIYDQIRQSLLDAGYEAPTAEEMGV